MKIKYTDLSLKIDYFHSGFLNDGRGFLSDDGCDSLIGIRWSSTMYIAFLVWPMNCVWKIRLRHLACIHSLTIRYDSLPCRLRLLQLVYNLLIRLVKQLRAEPRLYFRLSWNRSSLLLLAWPSWVLVVVALRNGSSTGGYGSRHFSTEEIAFRREDFMWTLLS